VAQEGGGAKANTGKGFIALGSLSSLDDMSLDLSDQLKPRPKPETPARSKPPPRPRDQRGPGTYARLPPTKGEARRWDRSRAASGRAQVSAVVTEEELTEDAKEKLERGRVRYEELKKQMELWTVGIAAVCFASTRAFYAPDVSTSYLVGAIGGFFYLRSLSRSVDAVGAEGGQAGAASPRLLIPLILVLSANRWNEIKAPEVGVYLEILPELLGFFTYKAAVVGLNFTSLLQEFVARDFQGGTGEEGAKPPRARAAAGEGGDGDDGDDGDDGNDDVTSVDRAFVKRMTWG